MIDSLIKQKMLRGGDLASTGLRSWTSTGISLSMDNNFIKCSQTTITIKDGPVKNFVDKVVEIDSNYPLQGILSYLGEPLSKYMVEIFSLDHEIRDLINCMYIENDGEK